MLDCHFELLRLCKIGMRHPVGGSSKHNLNSVYNLFQYLKSQFQFTMIVSHIDSMRDAVDTLLEIKKENTFSNVMFD